MEDETPTDSPVGTPGSTESKAQEQARLRRERRNAKLQAGGSARLNKILNSSGREAAAEAELAKASGTSAQSTPIKSASSTPPPRPAVKDEDDPEEVDISQEFKSNNTPRTQEDMFRAMLRAPPPGADASGGGAQGPGSLDQMNPDDPLAQMMQQMQQMLGGQPGAGGDAMPGLANILQGLQQAQGQEQPQETETSVARIWKIIHLVFSVSLGLYALNTFTFTASEVARTTTTSVQGAERIFYIFATVELILQSTRYFLEGGRAPPKGILAWAGRLLPDPYGHYARVLGRYALIYSTLLADALMILFILGSVTWWKGMAAS